MLAGCFDVEQLPIELELEFFLVESAMRKVVTYICLLKVFMNLFMNEQVSNYVMRISASWAQIYDFE